METIIIEKDIPIPPLTQKRSSSITLPFDRMNAGDSFLIACSDAKDRERVRSRIGGRAFKPLGARKLKLVSRTCAEGVRFWVTSPEA